MKKEDIVLIEDHHQALAIWRRKRIKNLPLIHLDAHIDFGFFPAKPFSQALGEAKSVKELKKTLEIGLLYRKYKKSLESQLGIGNYIYPAERDGIVSRFYWIVPGNKNEFKRGIKNIQRIIKGINAHDPHKSSGITLRKNSVSARLCNRQFIGAYLFAIKKISVPLLLDIDVDFLLFGSIQGKDISLIKNIGKRKPWMYPRDFVKIIRRKFPNPVCVTIAYSVNGGFTPLEYKFFGDEISLRLAGKLDPVLEKVFSLRDLGVKTSSSKKLEEATEKLRAFKGMDKAFKSRFLAHLYFWLFKLAWGENKEAAVKHYRKALKEDPSLRVRDNNLGPLYLRKGDLKSAENEFDKIIYCDPGNASSLCGLGEVLFRRKRYSRALEQFRAAVEIEPKNKNGLIGVMNCQRKLGRSSAAKRAFIRLKKIDPFYAVKMIARMRKQIGLKGLP